MLARVRSTLRDTANADTRKHPVDRLQAAADAVQLSIATTAVTLSPERTLAVTSSVRLTANPQGLLLQEQRLAAARERQLHLESDVEQVASVRDNYLRDGTTARIWALSQFPELVQAINSDVVQKVIQAAEETAQTIPGAGQSRTAADLLEWFTSKSDSKLAALPMLYRILDSCGEHDLRDRLSELGPVNLDPGESPL
ncbi:hypothetical protein ACFTSF_11020 [Kribbella sp. NPDC056951]|uniref:hypothetical protein n=1 Tax=Kribbella sp. NPDC056951 TaxID=3345978 RepID=UPI0036325271